MPTASAAVLSVRVSASERALLEAAAEQASTNLSDFVRRRALEAAETDLLDRRKLKRVPVVDGGALVGIITRGDLVRALVAQQSQTTGAEAADDGAVLAAVQERMHREGWLDSSLVTVVIKQGVAELSGLAASSDQRRALRLLVEDTPGVARVEDNLRLRPAGGAMV